MHLFRSILNAHFLRYVTLVIVACFIFCAHSIPHSPDINIYAAEGTDPNVAVTNTAIATYTDENGATIIADSNGNSTSIKDTDTTLISVLNTLVALISLIYVPFSMLSSWLLSPDWTFGDFIHLRPVLHSLWVFVSNTVYVVFAAMLIVVAIANIFGQSDSYAIKKMLPRFIIGVIMVPFTWWVVSASLSVSSYLTALTLRMPADIMNANSAINTRVQIPTKCTLDFTSENASKKIWTCEDPPAEGVDLAKHLLQSDGAYGIIPLYAYNIFKFDKLDEFKSILSSDATKTEAFNAMSVAEQAQYSAGDATTKSAMLQAAIIATGIGKIGIQFIMSLLFAIVFTVILIALVLVLFVRVIKMWMYAIFSPLFALKYFLSDKIDKDNAIAKFDFKEFIGLAMVPVVVSAALGFGFMFIMTFKTKMEQPINATTQKGIQSDYIKVTDNTANSGSIQFFGTTINIKLSEVNSAGVGADGTSVAAKDLSAALFNVLSGLITPIFGIVILWMAVMAAIKTSKVAGAAVEGIEKMGGEVAGMTKKLPGMVPLGTVTRDGQKIKVTGSGLSKMPDILRSRFEEKSSLERENMRQAMGFKDGKFAGLNSAVAAAGNDIQKMHQTMNQLAASGYTRDDLNQPAVQEYLKKYAVTVGLGDLNFDSANIDESLRKIGDKLQREGKLKTGESASSFVIAFKKGGQELSQVINITGSTILSGTTHNLRVDGTKKINYKLNGEEKNISIDIDDLASKTNDAERKAYIKEEIKRAFDIKSLSIEETSLNDLVNKILRANTPPGAGGGGTP